MTGATFTSSPVGISTAAVPPGPVLPCLHRLGGIPADSFTFWSTSRRLVSATSPSCDDHLEGPVGPDRAAHHHDKEHPMNTHADEVAGHAKEVTGIITGDDKLKAEGRNERTKAELAGKVDDAADKVGSGIEATQEKVDGLFHRLTHWVRRS